MNKKERNRLRPSKEEADKRKDLGAKISIALEKIISEKLGNLEGAVLLGNRLYNKGNATAIESDLGKKILPNIQVEMRIEKDVLEIGEHEHVRIEITNKGITPVRIAKIEDAIPVGFELVTVTNGCTYVSNYLDAHGLQIEPQIAQNIEINLRSTKIGIFLITPKILCTGSVGLQMVFAPEPIPITVRETILPDRIQTGFQDFDNLLLGGIPENYAVLLTSASCDERDLLIRRYMEKSLEENCLTFCVSIDPVSVQSLADEFKDSFYALVCNPHGQELFENNPNVFSVSGVDNLTEVNIALESILHIFDDIKQRKGRACLEIISDVLLQHQAIQTRKWLNGLIPELRFRGLTTLAVLNPFMHSSEELHSVLDLFDGEVNIYDKEPVDGYQKYLRIKRLHNQRYLDSELPLRKTRLMATPVKLSCCSRSPNV